MQTTDCDVAIIGSGVGGLTCGALSARQGNKVMVFEQHTSPGGYASSFVRKGFVFDAAVHFAFECHEGGIIRQIIHLLSPEDELKFHRIDPLCKVIFPGKSLEISADLSIYIEHLAHMFPEEKRGISDLFHTLEALYSAVRGQKFSSPLVEKYREKTFQELLEEFILDKELQAIVSAIWCYIATPPFMAAAIPMSMLIMNLFFQGAYYPDGGFQTLVNLLVKGLKHHGGQILLGTGVKKIIIEDGQAVGLTTHKGDLIKSRYVVSNADARRTFFDMVGEDLLPKEFGAELRTLEVCPSGFNVYLGVDMDLKSVGTDLSEIVVVHRSFDYKKEYEAMRNPDLENACFCLSCATLTDPNLAPQGRHCVNIFTPALYAPVGWDWNERKKDFAQRLISEAESIIPQLSKHIVVRDAATPYTLERYTSNTGGAIAGWAYDLETAFRRPGPKTPIKNLYLVGHWTLPGGGISGVATSGWNLSKLLARM